MYKNKKTKILKIRLILLIISSILFNFTFSTNGLFIINMFLVGYFTYLTLNSIKSLYY